MVWRRRLLLAIRLLLVVVIQMQLLHVRLPCQPDTRLLSCRTVSVSILVARLRPLFIPAPLVRLSCLIVLLASRITLLVFVLLHLSPKAVLRQLALGSPLVLLLVRVRYRLGHIPVLLCMLLLATVFVM